MGNRDKLQFFRLLNFLGPLLGLLFVIGVFCANNEVRPYFLTGANFKIILTQTVINTINRLVCQLSRTGVISSTLMT